jgi:polysaccharide export outer membrane protein
VSPRTLLRFAPAVFLMLLGARCATTPKVAYDYASEPDPRKQEYVLGVSDVLKVNVWKNPDLTVETVVRPDGTISLPLLGDLKAAGRTGAQLRAEIAQRLATYVKDESATVTVSVAVVNSYRFVVSGNVERAGAYNANHFVTVSEAIALAGGPNRFASPEEVVIIRNDATRGTRRIPVDYPSILSGRHPEQDLPVVAGDTIYVP